MKKEIIIALITGAFILGWVIGMWDRVPKCQGCPTIPYQCMQFLNR